jgi:hypothetical protein
MKAGRLPDPMTGSVDYFQVAADRAFLTCTTCHGTEDGRLLYCRTRKLLFTVECHLRAS